MKQWTRRFTLITLLLIAGVSLESEKAPEVHRTETVKEEDKLLKAIMSVESNYDTEIINHKEDAVGILQIRPIMLREVNRILALQGSYYRFSLDDRTDSVKSVQMWYIIQGHHNPGYDPMLACRIWNGGTKRYKPMSQQYWLKVQERMN